VDDQDWKMSDIKDRDSEQTSKGEVQEKSGYTESTAIWIGIATAMPIVLSAYYWVLSSGSEKVVYATGPYDPSYICL